MNTLEDAKGLRDRFNKLEWPWPTINLLPQGDDFRERCTKVEEQIARTWNEQIYSSSSRSNELVDLVKSAKTMRDLHKDMGGPPVPDVPELSADTAINRAKRLIEKGDADTALHILAATTADTFTKDQLGSLVPTTTPPAKTYAHSPGSNDPKPQNAPTGGFPRWLLPVIVSNLVLTLVALVGIFQIWRSPIIVPAPTIVVTAIAMVPTATPPTATVAPAATEEAVVATTTVVTTAPTVATTTVPSTDTKPTEAVDTPSQNSTPTSVAISLEPKTLPLHLLGTVTFAVTKRPESVTMQSIQGWKATLKTDGKEVGPIELTLTPANQPASLSFKLTVTDMLLENIKKQFVPSKTPVLTISFVTGDPKLTLPDVVTLTIETMQAKGLPKVMNGGQAEPPSNYPPEVKAYLLDKDAKVEADAQGSALAPLFAKQTLNDIVTRPTTTGSGEFPYQYLLIGNGDTVSILSEGKTANGIKVYLIRVETAADQNRKYNEGQTGWLPAVFVDGL